jgi:hypothetical protein
MNGVEGLRATVGRTLHSVYKDLRTEVRKEASATLAWERLVIVLTICKQSTRLVHTAIYNSVETLIQIVWLSGPCQVPVFSSIYCFIHLFTYAYIVWAISPPSPPPHPSPPHTPCLPGRTVLPLSLFLLKRKHKDNKEDKAFLLVEIRIAIQRDS